MTHATYRHSNRSAIALAEPAFVFVVWLATFLAVVFLIDAFGSCFVPVGDDIHDLIPGITKPFREATPWFWSQHNEHRLPLPKLILWVVLRATDFNLSVVMYMNAVAQALVSLLMVLTARHVRGCIRWTDAFFPIVAMCWGQASNFLIAWQTQFFLSTSLAAVILSLLSWRREPPNPTIAVLLSACLLLLPLCGANGLVLVPPVALWMLYSARVIWRSASRGRNWHAVVMVVSVLAALGFITIYVLGLGKPHDIAFKGSAPIPDPKMTDYVRTGLEFLSSALGEPVSVKFGVYGGIAVLAVVMLSVVGMVCIGVSRKPERYRAAGLGMFMLAFAGLTAAITYGRAGLGEGAGGADRYYTLMMPVWYCVYLIWTVANRGVGYVMQVAMLIAAGTVFAANVSDRREHAGGIRLASRVIEDDILARKPPNQIAQRWTTWYNAVDPDYFESFIAPRFRMLQKARLGPYKFLPEEPPVLEIPYSLKRGPVATHDATWDRGVCKVTGSDPSVVLSLPEPRFVYAIRFRYRYQVPESPGLFQLNWRWSEREADFDLARWAGYQLPVSSEERTLTVIVNDTIDRLRLQPAPLIPSRLEVTSITLLAPTNSVQ